MRRFLTPHGFAKTIALTLLSALLVPSALAAGPTVAPPTDLPYSTANSGTSTSTPLSIQSSTKLVPQGTFLTIAFNTNLDSKVTNVGEAFVATIVQDLRDRSNPNGQVVLPEGTLVRGRVTQVKRPGFFSKGGSIFLGFDHAVLPHGDLQPLSLNLTTDNTIVNPQGALYSDPGIPKKLERSIDSGVNTFSKMTKAGVDAGKDIGDGLGQFITVPLAAAGGVIAGTAVTTGKAAAAVVGRGESIVIQPGDTVNLDFGGSFNIPAQ